MGRENASIKVEKGFLNPFLTESNSDIKDAKSTFYKTSSQNNGKDYFEFFSINSNVEWSIYYTTDNEAYLATSNLINGDYSVGFLLLNHKDLIDKVERYDHSHTSEFIPSINDFSTASSFPNGGDKVTFNIFFIPKKEYYQFTRDTYEMPELIISGKRPQNN